MANLLHARLGERRYDRGADGRVANNEHAPPIKDPPCMESRNELAANIIPDEFARGQGGWHCTIHETSAVGSSTSSAAPDVVTCAAW